MGLEEVRRRFHPEDRERFGASPGDPSDDTVEDRRAPTIEYRWQCKDGEYRWLSDNRAFVRDEDGRVLAVVGTVRDITEQKRIEEEEQRAFEDTVMLLAVAAEARDPYTENHLLRIRGYSEAIASELGLSPPETREIGLASLLHDIGKMRVPDSILTKPGPLTAEEWQIMKQHPIWGEELLSLHPPFESARQIARWHHENWDGTGYPDGLRGEEIPIGAAVTAVADGFDAMTTQRPYKGAWPPARATREIRQNKGLRYSPKVVEAFERALRKGKIKKVATTSPPSISELVKAA
jgi:HD-GYP domain-containing protein (c-di-GMP phosphodiesterase class II)